MAIKPGKVCPKCGYKWDVTETICGLCYAKLDAPAGGGGAAEGAMFSIDRRGKDKHNAGKPAGPPGRPETIERCFVLLASGTPVYCEKGSVAVIGRDDAAQIKVALPKVSRRHAEVRWEGDVASVHDLGSANGTKVNGEKLAARGSHALKDNDEIDVGGGPMPWRVLPPGVSESTLKVTAQVTLVDQTDEPSSDDDLAGNAAVMPMGEILDRLTQLKAWGKFHIESGGIKGSFVFENGEVLTGSYAGLMDEAALAAVRTLKTGRFRFEAGEAPEAAPAPPPRPAQAPTQRVPPPPVAQRPAPGATGRPMGPPPGGPPKGPPPAAAPKGPPPGPPAGGAPPGPPKRFTGPLRPGPGGPPPKA